MLISEVADYEVRRELVRAGKTLSVARLDALQTEFVYLPINTATMRKAAALWAQTRNMGIPTASNLRLDADAIIAAQAALLIADGETVIIATSNTKHLAHLVPAADWQTIT